MCAVAESVELPCCDVTPVARESLCLARLMRRRDSMLNSRSDCFLDLYGGGRCSSSRLLARQWRTDTKPNRASTAYRLNYATSRPTDAFATSRHPHRASTAKSASFSLTTRRPKTPASSAAEHRRQSAGAQRATRDALELALNTLSGSERKASLACIAYTSPVPGPSSHVFFSPPRSALTFRRRGNSADALLVSCCLSCHNSIQFLTFHSF